ncbi:MAG: bifunctional adenosylcobinamide kinase/adenosylcobinamide-phosphate guanylyltransferase [Halanaerobiales bacterium]
MITLVTGGARSGKSSFAEKIVRKKGGNQVYYLATAEIRDEEMRNRVEKHRQQRPDEWETIEAPYEMAAAISRIPAGAVLLIDCMTVYISNLLLSNKCNSSDSESKELENSEKEDIESINQSEKEKLIKKRVEAVIEIINKKDIEAVIVANEVGQGIVPAYKLGRIYRDIAGRINQYLAEEAGEVFITFAGLPVEIKQLGQKNLEEYS